ncbi:MAG: hypothetical protein GF331_26515 [Chitinivibrionales bacterium]|nr:hypothetical protein [Chitinivibrionales bacterium]
MTGNGMNHGVAKIGRWWRLFAVLTVLCASGQAQEWCEFILTECPLQFQGDTIEVPERVIAMGPKVHGCEAGTTGVAGGGAPSIVFVIDNSGSMKGTGTGNNDPMGSRFTVIGDLLDSIALIHPDAEVGIVVFQEHLYFDTTTSEYFTQYFQALPVVRDGEPDQAYLRLLQLDREYAQGRTGREIIDDVLTVERDSVMQGTPDTLHEYVDLVYTSNFNNVEYTNINVAFEAAREALRAATNPPERQFVVFFSDGLPVGPSQGGRPLYDFVAGDSMPTTFTVFFTEDPDGFAPDSIERMTGNIRTNGYSSTNPRSDVWAIETSHDALLTLLMSNIMGIVLVEHASAVSITGLSLFDSSATYVDSYFILTERVPLEADLTPFTLGLAFRYTNYGTGAVRDTTIQVNFHVRRVPDSVAVDHPWITYRCWARPQLSLVHDGVSVVRIDSSMQGLQLRFTTGDTAVDGVTTAIASSVDSESVVLTDNGQYWIVPFPHATSSSGTPGDGTVQHRSTDSIVIVYRNPDLPLDTVRLTVACAPPPPSVPVTAVVRDTNGNGQFDRIDLMFPDSVTLLEQLPDVNQLLQSATFVTADGREIAITPVDLVRHDSTTLHIILRESATETSFTGWESARITLTDAMLTTMGQGATVNTVIDSVGPVVTRVILYPGATGTTHDTLRISFSEPVDCAQLTSAEPQDVFEYIDYDTVSDVALDGAAFAGTCTDGYISQVTVVVPFGGMQMDPLRDRIGFAGGSPHVTDTSGALTPHDGPRVPIELAAGGSVELAVYGNPVKAGREIPTKVASAYAAVLQGRSRGALIGVNSAVPLKEIQVGPYERAYGKAELYDAVGNLVRRNLPVLSTGRAGQYGIYWDLENHNTRLVGNGTYLMIVKTTDIAGNERQQRIKIGVQR